MFEGRRKMGSPWPYDLRIPENQADGRVTFRRKRTELAAFKARVSVLVVHWVLRGKQRGHPAPGTRRGLRSELGGTARLASNGVLVLPADCVGHPYAQLTRFQRQG